MKNTCNHTLIDALKNSGKAPAERLAHVFEIIGQMPASASLTDEQDELLQYLAKLAKSSHIHQPEAFAQQVFIMAADAWQKQLAQPDSHALKHAQIAAKALITAQTRNRFSRNSHIYAMAASFFLISGISGMMFANTLLPIASEAPKASPLPEAQKPQALLAINNPMRLSEMISNREKMREGRCQFPEALVFAENERGIYLQNVVHGDITNDIKVQEVANRLMQSVRCDYTPMLMRNSIS